MAREMTYGDFQGTYGSRVRWGAIVAGFLIAIVTQVILGLLGLAFGLSGINPTTHANVAAFGVGGGLWLLVTTIISAFLGAWAASSWANIESRADGLLHGIITWSLFMVVTTLFIGTGVGSLLGGTFNLVSSGLSSSVPQSYAAAYGGGVVSPRPAAMPTNMQAQAPQATQATQAVPSRNVSQPLSSPSQVVAWWGFFALILSLIASAIGGLVGVGERYKHISSI